MRKPRIISALRGVYRILRSHKLESVLLLIYVISVVSYSTLFVIKLVDLKTFIESTLALGIAAVLVVIGLIQSSTETNIISTVAQYMLKGDASLKDELLGIFITRKWKIAGSDPVKGIFSTLEDTARRQGYEMHRRISEALPALFHWQLDKAEEIAKVLRRDWDDDKRSDIRRRTVEAMPFLLRKKPESAKFFLDYHEKDEVFTAMAIVEVAWRWLNSDRKKAEEFLKNFKSKVQAIYSREEMAGLNELIELVKMISDNTPEAVRMMEARTKSDNLYVRVGVARNIPSVIEKFPEAAFRVMECFLDPEEHKWVRRPIAKENCTRAILKTLKNPKYRSSAESVLRKLFKDSDELIRITAFDLMDDLMAIDTKLCLDVVTFVISTEENEDLQRRARRFKEQIQTR